MFKSDGQSEGKVLVRYKKQDSKTDVKSSNVDEEEITMFLIIQEKCLETQSSSLGGFLWIELMDSLLVIPTERKIKK